MVEVAPVGDRRRLGLLDASRLAAALAVVAFHYTGRMSPAWGQPVQEVFPLLSRVTQYGALGVYLFFMISGFVVLMSAWGRNVGEFTASRVGRLYPAYWLAVLVTSALLFVERGTEIGASWSRIGFTGVVANLTMFQTVLGVPHVDGVYWTLWVELKFYVLIGLLIRFGLTENRVLAASVVLPLLGAAARATGEPLLTELLFPDQAPYFAVGMLLYLVYRRGWTKLTAVSLALNLALAVSLSTTAVAPFYAAVAGVRLSPAVTGVLVLLFAAVLAAIALTRLSTVHAAGLVAAGSLTYPLYLLHELFGWRLLQAVHPFLPPYAALAMVTVIMLAWAYLVYRFVERPLGPRVRKFVSAGFSEIRQRTSRD